MELRLRVLQAPEVPHLEPVQHRGRIMRRKDAFVQSVYEEELNTFSHDKKISFRLSAA